MVTKFATRESRVFDRTLKSARLGSPDAQYEVGLMYANGVGVDRNIEQAVSWIRQAAERGLPPAQYLLGTRYSTGIGLEKDQHKAFRWYLKAADQGHSKALYKLGMLYATAHRELSWSNIRSAAELGLAEAQLAVGTAFANGSGVDANPQEALHWHQKAADQGLPSAQCALAHAYANGLGVDRDRDEALIWYRKAVQQNSPMAQVALEYMDASAADGSEGRGRGRGRRKVGAAERRRDSTRWSKVTEFSDPVEQYHLALMYELGLGTEQDTEKAKTLYLSAAKLGEVRAQAALAKLYEIAHDPASLGWYTKAAEQADPDAQFALGRIYSAGQAVERDSFLGIFWYAQAAQRGDARALLTLGHLFNSGMEEAAAACFHRAAEKGDAQAQFSLGQQYSSGKFVTKNSHTAFSWWRRAAEQGYAPAQCAVGVAYLDGRGAAKDAGQARNWLQKAADQGDAKAQWNLGALFVSGAGEVKQDLKLAFEWCKSAAEMEFVPAQATLGSLFARLKKFKEASYWLSKAAEKGDPEAQHNLALMYFNGQGLQEDRQQAFHWFAAAAAQGVVSAQSRLGLMYATGDGAVLDPIEAHKWLIIADIGGDGPAKTNRKRSEHQLTPLQIAEAQRRADSYLSPR